MVPKVFLFSYQIFVRFQREIQKRNTHTIEERLKAQVCKQECPLPTAHNLNLEHKSRVLPKEIGQLFVLCRVLVGATFGPLILEFSCHFCIAFCSEGKSQMN